jgi:drug/metabolite transporter (DMT)-like permease
MPRTTVLYLKLTMVALMWGGTFVAGRALAGELSPLAASTARYGIAVLALLFLSHKIEGGLPRLNLQQIVLTIILGATGVFLYNVFFFSALAQMPASRTALFVAFNPIAVATVMFIVTRQRLDGIRILGITIALVGALVVISRGDLIGTIYDLGSSFGIGELSMLAGVLSWTAYTIVGRKALGTMSPLASTTYAAIWGFLMLVGCLAFANPTTAFDNATWMSVGTIAYLAICGTAIPFVWYYQGVQELGAERAAVFTNLVPVFGVLLGFILLNEPLSLSMLVGGALVLGGVTLTNR